MNVAKLTYDIDSSKAKTAGKNLGGMSKAAKDAERSQKGLSGASTRAGQDLATTSRSAGLVTKAYTAMRVAALAAIAALTIGLVGVVSFMGKFVSSSVEAQKQQAQLASALRSTGGAAGQTLASLNAYAAALQKVTNFGDETINSAQGILLTFTRIGGDIFPRATEAVLDVATAMGTDLKSAAIQVGKALNDPVLGMTALSRSGITFTEAQKELVKSMVASGDIIGAQTLILKELETQFGGSAKAARNTLGGALAALGNAWGDLFEIAGPASESLRLSLEGLVDTITTQAFVNAAQAMGESLFNGLSKAANAVVYLVDNIGTLIDILGILIAGRIAAGIVAIAGGITAIGTASGIAAVAVRGLSAAMAFFGGPIGLAVTALGGAFLLLRNNVSAVDAATRDSEGAYQNNIALLNAAKASSEGYTAALRNQLAMQFEVAKSNSILAGEAKTAAAARSNAFTNTFGFEFDLLEYDFDQKNAAFKSAFLAAEALAAQLREVDANMKTVAAAATDAGAAANDNLGGLGKAAAKAADAYKKIVEGAQQFTATQVLEREALGMTEQAANAVRYEQELLNKAQAAGIKLTTSQKDELHSLAVGMAGVEAETSRLKGAMDFAKGATSGFLSDLRSGLMNGEGFFKSFGKAAMGVLDKIINKLEDQLVNALFSASSAGSGLFGGGSGGGLFSSILGGIGKLFGFAKGTDYAPGGVAMVGERGPELVNLPRGSKVNTASETRRMMNPANQNGGQSVKVTVDARVYVDDDGKWDAKVERISQKQVERAAPAIIGQATARVLPTINEYQGNRAGSDFRTA